MATKNRRAEIFLFNRRGTRVDLQSYAMKISDLLVIYFSCGAPVAAYFHFERRARLNAKELWLKTLGAFLFWIPLAAWRLLMKIKIARKNNSLKSGETNLPQTPRERNLHRLQKRLEEFARDAHSRRTVFELRETLERYAGLTLALETEAGATAVEFFLAAENGNAALAAKCFARRNRQRLVFHQSSARRDFLQILWSVCAASSTVNIEIGETAFKFAKILRDREAQKAVENMFLPAPLEERGKALAEDTRQIIWKPKTSHAKQLGQTPISLRLISTDTSRQTAPTALRKNE